MSKHPNTCIHNKVSGYQALEALLTAQHRGHVCQVRAVYLTMQVINFKKYVEEKGEDFSILRLELKEKLESIWRQGEGEVGDMQVDSIPPMDFHEHRFNEEAKCLEQYSAQFWGNCTKAMSKYYQDRRMLELQMQEELTDMEEKAMPFLLKAQTEFDGHLGNKERPISKTSWRVVKKFQKRIHDMRFKEGKLEYTEWAMLSNWTNRLLSNPKRYKVNDPRSNEDIWAEISEQDLFLWTGKEEAEQEEECRVLDEIHISNHYADMSKVTVTRI